MTIRPYHDGDLATLKAITVEAFDGVSIDQNIERKYGLIAGHDWRWRKARQIDDDVAAPDAKVWVAEADDHRIVGFITTRVERDSGVGLIPNMGVRAELRGQGIGRQLIEHALQHFRSAGLRVARIETLEQNAIGQHLYPSCGFVEVARQIHFARELGS